MSELDTLRALSDAATPGEWAAMSQAEQHAAVWPSDAPCHDRDCALHNPPPAPAPPATDGDAAEGRADEQR